MTTLSLAALLWLSCGRAPAGPAPALPPDELTVMVGGLVFTNELAYEGGIYVQNYKVDLRVLAPEARAGEHLELHYAFDPKGFSPGEAGTVLCLKPWPDARVKTELWLGELESWRLCEAPG